MNDDPTLYEALAGANTLHSRIATRAARHAAAGPTEKGLAAKLLARPDLPAAEALRLWQSLANPTIDERVAILSRRDLPAADAEKILKKSRQAGVRRDVAASPTVASTTATLLMDRHADDADMLLNLTGNRAQDSWRVQATAALLLDDLHTGPGGKLATSARTEQLEAALGALPGRAATRVAEHGRSRRILCHLTRGATTEAAAANLIDVLVVQELAPVRDGTGNAHHNYDRLRRAVTASAKLSPQLSDTQRATLWEAWKNMTMPATLCRELEVALYPNPERVLIGKMGVRLTLQLCQTSPAWAGRLGAYLAAHGPTDDAGWAVLNSLSATFPGTVDDLLESAAAIQRD